MSRSLREAQVRGGLTALAILTAGGFFAVGQIVGPDVSDDYRLVSTISQPIVWHDVCGDVTEKRIVWLRPRYERSIGATWPTVHARGSTVRFERGHDDYLSVGERRPLTTHGVSAGRWAEQRQVCET